MVHPRLNDIRAGLPKPANKRTIPIGFGIPRCIPSDHTGTPSSCILLLYGPAPIIEITWAENRVLSMPDRNL